MKKESLANTILFIISISVFLIFGEAFIRLKSFIYPPPIKLEEAFESQNKTGNTVKSRAKLQIEKSIFTTDKITRYRLKPNLKEGMYHNLKIRTNSMGLRYKEINPKKDSSTYRVLFVGDSIVYGFGLKEKERISDMLEKKLRKNLQKGKKLEIVNCGVPGFSNAQELAFFESSLVKLKPDMVIICFCLNDFETRQVLSKDGTLGWDNLGEMMYNMKDRNDTAYLIIKGLRKANKLLFNNQISEHSMFSKWLYSRMSMLVKAMDTKYFRRFPWEAQADVCMGWRDKHYESIEKNIREFYKLSKEKEFNLIFTVFPYKSQLVEEYRKRDLEYVMKPQNKLRNICKKLGIQFFSMHERFLEYVQRTKNNDLYFDNIHPNIKGSKIAAQELYDYLLNNNPTKNPIPIPLTSGVLPNNS